jgi:pimeloyl-ACP methyl ester carboxylesterase
MSRIRLGRKGRRLFYKFLLAVFLLINILTFAGAYLLTHFSAPGYWGVIPKPSNQLLPSDIGLRYVTQRIAIAPNEWLEAWFIPSQSPNPKGTVLLFPGNVGSKSKQLLAPTQVFHPLGYDALLVDFRGLGGSSGNTTTIGMKEAKDVALTVQYAQRANLKRPFILYGVSMGSAAILRAVDRENVKPTAVILELPFARFLDAIRSRLRAIRLPVFGIAELVVFWGSVQHQVNGFTHDPLTYAKSVRVPTLLLHGSLDIWTSVAEIEEIAKNLNGEKRVVLFPKAGHDLLVTVDKKTWSANVEQFLGSIKTF